jgi:hypothetical protein
MESILSFFSSNKRKLYEEDIFKVMSLPQDYVIHFRYNKQWIHADVLDKLPVLKNRRGIIYYAYYVQGAREPDALISVREVEINDIIDESDTELVHFYLKLKAFCKADFKDASPELLPPIKSVSFISIQRVELASWINRIESLKDKLSMKSYFQIKRIFTDNNNVEVMYSEHERESYYQLEDEKEYFLEVNYADYSENTSAEYKYETEGAKIFANVPGVFNLGTLKDQRVHGLIVQSVAKKKIPAYLKIYADKNLVMVKMLLRKSAVNSFVFGILLVVGAIALTAVQSYTKIISDKIVTEHPVLILAMVSALMFYAAYQLYYLFDKK